MLRLQRDLLPRPSGGRRPVTAVRARPRAAALSSLRRLRRGWTLGAGSHRRLALFVARAACSGTRASRQEEVHGLRGLLYFRETVDDPVHRWAEETSGGERRVQEGGSLSFPHIRKR
jgi:hypothetical protein